MTGCWITFLNFFVARWYFITKSQCSSDLKIRGKIECTVSFENKIQICLHYQGKRVQSQQKVHLCTFCKRKCSTKSVHNIIFIKGTTPITLLYLFFTRVPTVMENLELLGLYFLSCAFQAWKVMQMNTIRLISIYIYIYIYFFFFFFFVYRYRYL